MNRKDFEGHDNYERVAGRQNTEHGVNYEKIDRGAIFGEFSPYEQVGGRASMRGMGGGPFDLPQVPSVIDVVYEGPVRYVGISHKLPVTTLLEYMSFSPNVGMAQGADPMIGAASVVAFSLGQRWITDFVSQGYVVMIKWPIDPTQTVPAVASKNPAVIAQHATDAGGFMIVDGPQALIVSAGSAALQNQTPVTPVPPPPGTVSPESGTQVVVSGGGTPNWVLPVVIGVGALGILALVSVVKSRKPRSQYAMNRKHHRCHRNGRKARKHSRSKVGM
jgi:hypothetical protein